MQVRIKTIHRQRLKDNIDPTRRQDNLIKLSNMREQNKILPVSYRLNKLSGTRKQSANCCPISPTNAIIFRNLFLWKESNSGSTIKIWSHNWILEKARLELRCLHAADWKQKWTIQTKKYIGDIKL